MIFVARNGQNSIAVAGGATKICLFKDIDNARRIGVGAGAVLIQLETPLSTIEAAVGLAAVAGGHHDFKSCTGPESSREAIAPHSLF